MLFRSIIDFDFRKEFRVSDFPIQSGSFASYNKVSRAFEIAVRMTKGGSQDDRTQFLTDIETVVKSLGLYSAVTPEKTYLNANFTRSELSRKSVAGAFFLVVDLFLIEIRQVSAQYSTTSSNTQNAQQPSAQPAVNQGKVQPQVVTPTVGSALTNGPNQVSVQLGAAAIAQFNAGLSP